MELNFDKISHRDLNESQRRRTTMTSRNLNTPEAAEAFRELLKDVPLIGLWEVLATQLVEKEAMDPDEAELEVARRISNAKRYL